MRCTPPLHQRCRPAYLRRGLEILGLCSALAAPAGAQRFQFDYGMATPQEIGTTLITGPLGYGVLGRRDGTDLLVLGADPTGTEILDYPVLPFTATNLTPHDVLAVSTGGFMACGEVLGAAMPDHEVFLAAFDNAGALVSPLRLLVFRGHATGIHKGPRVVERSGSGGFAVATNMDPGTPTARGVLFGTFPNLLMQWWYEYTYGNQPIELHDLCEDADGTLVACGTIQDPGTLRRRVFLLRTTALGIPICATSLAEGLGDTLDVEHTSLTRTKDGAFAIWGHYGALSSRPGSFLCKVGGQCFSLVNWKSEYSNILYTRATIAEYPNGDLVCNGRVLDSSSTNDGLVLRTNSNGLFPAARAYGAAGTAEELYQVATTADGGYAAVGSTGMVSASLNAYLVKTDTSGVLECHERVVDVAPQPRPLQPRAHLVFHESHLTQYYVYIRVMEPWSVPTPLCSEPPCFRAPRNLALWLPFDETSGTTAGNALAMAGAPNGAYVGSPTPITGKVDGALSMNGASDYVTVPHHGAINVGIGDFAIDAWINLPAAPTSGVHTLVDKRTVILNETHGYSFFLYTQSNGSTQLGVQLADGTLANYLSPILPVVPGTWHFVAVTVRRSSGSSYFAFDNTYHSFTAGHPGSLANTAALHVARNSPGFGTNAYVGDLDELELFRRAVTPSELHGIWSAGSEGKCKEACFLPGTVGICHLDSSVVVTGYVCNATRSPQIYTLWFQGLPTGSGCTVQGPTTFTLDPTVIGAVPSMACMKFSVTIQRPALMTQVNQLACYQMLVSSTSGESMLCSGKIRDVWINCPYPYNGNGQILKVMQRASVGPIRLQNLGSQTSSLAYRLTALDGFGEPDATALSLNGLAPGAPLTGNAFLSPNGYADIYYSAEFVEYDGLRPFFVQIEADIDGDGQLEAIGTQTLRCDVGEEALATYIGTPAPTSQGTPRLDVDLFPVSGTTVAIRASGLVPFGISILCASFAPAQPALSLAWLGAQPAANLYLDVAQLMAFTLATDAGGNASFPMALPDDPALSGVSVYWQVIDIDPALPYPLPIGCSSGMQLVVR